MSKYSSFEVLEAVINTQTELIRLCVVYRCTQATSKQQYQETKLALFIEEFSEYIDNLNSKAGKPIICGDFNFHVEHQNNSAAQEFISLYENKGFNQHVNFPTHNSGGTLDLILTSSDNVADHVDIDNIGVIQTTGTTSDHYLIHFDIPSDIETLSEQLHETKHIRQWQNIDVDQFKADIIQSLPPTKIYTSLEYAIDLFHNALCNIADEHAPIIPWDFKINKTPWWNTKCQAARRERCKAECIYKKHKDPTSKSLYKEKSIDSAIVIDRERNKYYHQKLHSTKGDTRATYI